MRYGFEQISFTTNATKNTKKKYKEETKNRSDDLNAAGTIRENFLILSNAIHLFYFVFFVAFVVKILRGGDRKQTIQMAN